MGKESVKRVTLGTVKGLLCEETTVAKQRMSRYEKGSFCCKGAMFLWTCEEKTCQIDWVYIGCGLMNGTHNLCLVVF